MSILVLIGSIINYFWTQTVGQGEIYTDLLHVHVQYSTYMYM